MRLQGLSSVIAAAISAALVGGAVATAQDPQTALEAVPAPVSSAAPSPFLAAAELPSLPMRVAAVDVARNEDRELTFDPFSAPTPEIAPLEGPRIPDPPPPSAPPTISAEPSIGSLGDLVDGDLFAQPVNGRRTSAFGMRFHPVLRRWKLHTGLDFAAPCGTPIGAAAGGRVVATGWAGGNGVQVKIDHGWIGGYRLVTTYNHLSAIGVRVGQVVEALDGIGRVGNTGYSTGCHLHFEVIANGQFTDPDPWLNGKPSRVDLSSVAFFDVPDMPSPLPSATPSLSPSPSKSPSPSASASLSPLLSLSPSGSPSPSASPSPSLSWSPSPSLSPSPSPSVSPSPSPVASPAPSPTPSPAVSDPSPTPSAIESSPVAAASVASPSTEAASSPAPEPTTPAPPPPPPTTEAPPPTTQAPEPAPAEEPAPEPAPTSEAAPEPTAEPSPAA